MDDHGSRSAFPIPGSLAACDSGLSKREYYAATLLPAIVVDAMRHNAIIEHPHDAVEFDEMAAKAVRAADALIEALKR